MDLQIRESTENMISNSSLEEFSGLPKTRATETIRPAI